MSKSKKRDAEKRWMEHAIRWRALAFLALEELSTNQRAEFIERFFDVSISHEALARAEATFIKARDEVMTKVADEYVARASKLGARR